LRDVGLDGDTTEEPVVGDADGVFILGDGVVEEFLLGVGRTQFEVVQREFGLEGEKDCLTVGGGGLGLFTSGCDVATNRTPEIDLIVELEREQEQGLASAGRGAVEIGLIGGEALPSGEGIHAKRWIAVGILHAEVGASGAEVGVGGLESLIREGHLWLQRIEPIVMEDRPPVATRNGVLGLGDIPCGILP